MLAVNLHGNAAYCECAQGGRVGNGNEGPRDDIVKFFALQIGQRALRIYVHGQPELYHAKKTGCQTGQRLNRREGFNKYF